ncbi:MAG: hypothetical protein COS89_08375 [Deltaproteobacteria bacterium CG07_land_8_20_14_0_80_38_7]|nr:MAG: hypothetical protein COS89_08375 [Deltaproteobacteria bacterium CG07_land_8_20_14_0_80_38_7]
MIKAIFFDIGNTLFFYNYDFLRGLLEERYDIDVSTEELEATHIIISKSFGEMVQHGLSHKDSVDLTYKKWFRSLGIDEGKIDDIINTIHNHPFKHLFWSKIGDRTVEVLNWFKDHGYKLGVISNAEGQVKRLIEYAGIDASFDTILDSQEVGFQKPDEKIFLKALDDIGVKPEEAVHVGDVFEADVLGARSVGISPILVDRDNFHPNADCTRIKNIGELKDLAIFKDK